MQMPTDSPHDLLKRRLFLSVPEVAELLGCDERTIRRGCTSGDVPCTKIGAKWIIPVSWVKKQAGLQ